MLASLDAPAFACLSASSLSQFPLCALTFFSMNAIFLSLASVMMLCHARYPVILSLFLIKILCSLVDYFDRIEMAAWLSVFMVIFDRFGAASIAVNIAIPSAVVDTFCWYVPAAKDTSFI